MMNIRYYFIINTKGRKYSSTHTVTAFLKHKSSQHTYNNWNYCKSKPFIVVKVLQKIQVQRIKRAVLWKQTWIEVEFERNFASKLQVCL